MTVTLELKPEIEERALEQAATRGGPLETFLEPVMNLEARDLKI